MAVPESTRFTARGRVHLGRLLAGLAALLVCVAAAAGWLQHEFEAPGPAREAVRIDVEPGTSVRSVLARLESEGSLRNARAVAWYLRLHGRKPRVQSGAYELPAHASPAQILALFEEGKVILEQVTVVEGATFADFLDALEQHPRVAHTLTGKSAAEIMTALGHPGLSPEGQFFPDTYRFAANTSDAAILALAYDSMQRTLAAAWQARSPDLPLATPYEALILASIIEKEAALESERATIAGVFVNRLRKGMRLQSDPTVVYGLGEHYDGTISKIGVDIGYTKGGVIIWNVIAPSTDVKPGALEGGYGGATGSATVGVGLGANVLLGGSNKSIALQPVSIEGNTGLNVAAGIGGLNLKYNKG